MPGFEDNLLIAFFVLAALATVTLTAIALWKPLLSRVWRYFHTWWERDQIAEAEAKRLKECRAQAEAEISGDALPPISCPPVEPNSSSESRHTSSESSSTVQKVTR